VDSTTKCNLVNWSKRRTAGCDQQAQALAKIALPIAFGVTTRNVHADTTRFIIDGRREHACWYTPPPYGTYTIEINYHATCDQRGSTTWYVVIEIGNEEREFSGTISPGLTVLVDQFRVACLLILPSEVHGMP